MKNYLKLLIILLIITSNFSTSSADEIPNTPIKWNSHWLTHPDILLNEHAVILFRKTFELKERPASFIIHVTADNRYRLFVNEQAVCTGPARSDLHYWYYETVDISTYLKPGKNIVAAEVVNFGPKRAFSQFSCHTGFMLQGHGPDEYFLNTDPKNKWKVFHSQAVQPRIVEWMYQKDVAFGLYVANPTDSIDAAQYPWGWQRLDFNDENWKQSKWLESAGSRNGQFAGGINYQGGWLLVPRPVKLLAKFPEPFTKIARTEGIEKNAAFLKGNGVLMIPAYKKATILIDQTFMTIGYPELLVSQGKDSRIQITYAEALFGKNKIKGHRNELEGKQIIGIKDIFMPDGGPQRLFRPLWLRSFRFVQLDIQTQAEPLMIHDFHNQYSSYPAELKAAFETDDPQLNRLMEPGWRTAKICAQDLLMSDAYYEQMQYVGDARVHALTLLYLSNDDALVRNALVQFDRSRIPDGLTLACYPNNFHLVIPMYSLVWIDMLHDYMMLRGDAEFLAQFEMGIKNVIEWYTQRLQPNGLLGPLEWWNDVDWSPGFPNGVPPGIEQGNSALFTLHLAYTAQHAAELFKYIGKDELVTTYETLAQNLKKAAKAQCYQTERGLFAETPAMQHYSQHTNILAILTETVTGEDAKILMEKILNDASLSQCALFFKFYLFEALKKTGMTSHFFTELKPWHAMLDQGLSTFTEIPIDYPGQRSDCHPWSTSPNIMFYKIICGIEPAEPGFKSVRIQPELGHLKMLIATFPHPAGDIIINLKRGSGKKIIGKIVLPNGVKGEFWCEGKTALLEGGREVKID